MELSKKTMKRLMLLVTFTLLLYWALTHTAHFTQLLQRIVSLLSPFLLGLCIAYVIDLLLRALEKAWEKSAALRRYRKLKRPLCLTVSVLLILGILLAVVLVVVPELRSTFETISSLSTVYWQTIADWWTKLEVLAAEYELELPDLNIDPAKAASAVKKFLSENGHGFLTQTVSGITSVVGSVVNFVLGLVFALYVLAQKETLARQANAVMKAFLPQRTAERVRGFFALADRIFSSFVTGQLTEAVIIGTLCFLGMLALKMPYAPAISVLVGFTALIPVFGAFIGTAVGALLILVDTPIKALWFVLFILVLQ